MRTLLALAISTSLFCSVSGDEHIIRLTAPIETLISFELVE